MEAPGPPQPCVRLVEPASPAPPSVAPTPLPEKHEGTVISAAPVRSEAALPPQSHSIDGEGSKVSASVPKKMRVMKKAGDVQPPRAPARSPAAPSTQASAQEVIDVVAMDDAQQLLEESPARFVLYSYLVISFCMIEVLLQMMSKSGWSCYECIIYNCRVAAIPFWIPQIGMTFSSFDEAWNFWVTYGGRMGFDVRKCYTNTSPLDGLVTSSRFVCSFKSGFSN